MGIGIMNPSVNHGSPKFKMSRNESPYGMGNNEYKSPDNYRTGLLKYSFNGPSPSPPP